MKIEHIVFSFFLGISFINISEVTANENTSPNQSKAVILREMCNEFMNYPIANNSTNWSEEDDDYDEAYAHKQLCLNIADRNRKEANECFVKAENCTPLIPDLNIKERLKTLISSAISTGATPNPKEKILIVGLAILGDLANHYGFEIYEKMSEIREQLALGSAYLERANYWYSKSIHAPIRINNGQALSIDVYQHAALDYLIILDMFTTTVENRVDGKVISNYIYVIRNSILSEIENHGVIIKKHSDDLDCFSENLSEIVAEWNKYDKALVDEIYRLLDNAKENLKIAEELLGIK